MKSYCCITTVIVVFFGFLCPAKSGPVKIAENNKSYPSWYWRLVSGCCCAVEVEIVDKDTRKIQVTTKVTETSSGNLISTTSDTYDQYGVKILNEMYTPLYYMAQNTSISNAKIKDLTLKVYESHRELVDYDITKLKVGSKIVVLLEPFPNLDVSALKITHIFNDEDLNLVSGLLQKLPRFKDAKDGIFMDK